MKKPLLLLTSILILVLFSYTASRANTISNDIKARSTGGNTSVTVNNDVNTSNSTSTVRGTTTTNIDINNSGGGTSEVTVNGKTYKVEGTGSLSVRETGVPSNTSITPSSTPTPSNLLTLTPTAALPESPKSMSGFFERLFESVRKLFSKLF